jgi:hypothetical protein
MVECCIRSNLTCGCCSVGEWQTLRKWLQDEQRKLMWKAIVADRRKLVDANKIIELQKLGVRAQRFRLQQSIASGQATLYAKEARPFFLLLQQ